MLEVPEDFVYDITPTPYGMSLSVTIERPHDKDGLIELCPPWESDIDIDEEHF